MCGFKSLVMKEKKKKKKDGFKKKKKDWFNSLEGGGQGHSVVCVWVLGFWVRVSCKSDFKSFLDASKQMAAVTIGNVEWFKPPSSKPGIPGL